MYAGTTLEPLDPVRTGPDPLRAPVAPVLKWPGGKSGELAHILAAMPRDHTRYAEPFVGGGAVFLASPRPVEAHLNDTSSELIALYRALQSQDPALRTTLLDVDAWWRAWEDWVATHGTALVACWTEHRGSTRFPELVADATAASVDTALARLPRRFDHLADRVRALVLGTVPKKLLRMRKVEQDRAVELPTDDVWRNVEGAYKAVIYTALRDDYNGGRLAGRSDPYQVALFYFLREYAYAAMFRFNKRGEFNVPYGGISYNRKDFGRKIAHLCSEPVHERLRDAHLTCVDFEVALERFAPTATDFVFLDPPYDSDFADYDRATFDRADHERLAAVLRGTDARFMLVIKSTDFIDRLYPADTFNVVAFDKTYMWTIKERNDRAAKHLMITNYDVPLDLTDGRRSARDAR